MLIGDSRDGYGIVSRGLHWLMAIAVFAMFGLGWWMVGLDYYSPYYNAAPSLHRSAGMVLLAVLLLRLVWRALNVKPDTPELTAFEGAAARAVHWGFYPLLLALMVSGYLISTPDGRPIDVFGVLSVPSLVQDKTLSDKAGLVHEYLAYATIGLAVLHSAAALKHHFIDRSKVLTRMWSGPPAP